MTKEYVQQYAVLERTHWWFLVRQKIILRFLHKHLPEPHSKSLRILNIGAAGGASSEFLAVFGKVVSVENEPAFIAYLKTNNIDVTTASITGLPFADNSFDLVCAFDVIEHVEDDFAAMNELRRVCTPMGAICVTVPAFNMLWSNHDVVNGHYRRYEKKQLTNLLNRFEGLKIHEMAYFNSLLFLPIYMLRKITNLVAADKKERPSDFSYFKMPSLLNRIFKIIFSLEIPLMRLFHFPFGVSLLAFLQKNEKPKE
jgi:SAM-dependent methyltransferase